MLVNQAMTGVIGFLSASPAYAEQLHTREGVDIDHLTLGKGKVRMVIVDDTAKLKIKVGSIVKNFAEHSDVIAMNLTDDMILYVADRKAKKHIDITDRIIYIDKANKKWIQRAAHLATIDPKGTQKLSALTGEEFAAVIYEPQIGTQDTNFWVFVNTRNAEIISWYKEK